MKPSKLSSLALALTAAIALPALHLLATCGGGGGGGGGSQKDYKTWWTKAAQAKKKAETARFGILYYFPPKGKKDEHSLFKTKAIETQSLASPMVKVADEKLHLLRETYKPNDKLHTVIITDWYGNLISRKPFLAKDAKMKMNLKAVLEQIKSADAFAEKTQKTLAKKLAKAEKAFEKKRWSSAIKEYLVIVELEGYEQCAKATERLEEIVEEGRAEIERTTNLDGAEKKKALKKIAKAFKGTAVEKEAEEALAEIDGTAFHFLPGPSEAVQFWATFRAEFELIEIDEAWLAGTLQVQHLVVSGAEAEAQHDYAKAQANYERAVALDPSCVVARRYLGEFHRHHTGEWDLAKTHFQSIIDNPSVDPYSHAIALHGIGKMTIHGGEFNKGVSIIEQSVRVHPTQLAYRNLAVYWYSEGETERARNHVKKAIDLDPVDPYTRVFEAVYIADAGDFARALKQIAETPFDLSMSYNVACVYSQMRDKEQTLHYLRQHFYDYEFTDLVRRKEMWEARTDWNFKWLFEDNDFRAVTHLAMDETGSAAGTSGGG